MMAQKTKVKEDFLGLYVLAGGYVARPFNGTRFKEGDEVKAHHFGGSTRAGVTISDQNFKRSGKYETWSTTGFSSPEFKKLSESEIRKQTNWYRDHCPWKHIGDQSLIGLTVDA